MLLIGCVVIVFFAIKSEESPGLARASAVILLLSAGYSFFILLLSLRRLAINRSRFFMACVLCWFFISLAFLLGGLKVFAPIYLIQLLGGTGLLWLPFFGQRPVRMDYNLFLRAAESMLPRAETAVTNQRHSKSEIMAFARFLGARWLASQFRWSDAGLALFLPPVGSQWITRGDSMLDPTTRGRSHIWLGWDGRVISQLGQKDRRVLAKLGNVDTVPQAEWEARVSAAVAAAWREFEAGRFAAAESALGQVAESDIFIVSPARGGVGKVRC